MDLISWKFAIFSLCIFFGSGLVKNIVVSANGGTWCVAKPGASSIDLQHALDYACGEGGADCVPINPGGSCFTPDTLQDHASYAFNSYYQKHPIPTSCVFGGAATFTNTDPSNGNCQYPSGSSTSSPGGSTPATPSQPSKPTQPIQPGLPAPTTPFPPSQPSQPSQPGLPAPTTPFPPGPPTFTTPTTPIGTVPGGTTPTTPVGTVPGGTTPTRSGATSTFLSLPMLFACGLLILLQVANFI